MRFLPYAQTRAISNVIVDGARNEGTLLTLSHWPKSGTPQELRADTSTAIVFNYLDAPSFHVAAEAVSNNHFDEDGLLGIFAMLQPSLASQHRELLIDAAEAGDFGVYDRRQAARMAFAISACADPDASPFPNTLFDLPYADLAGGLYFRLLEMLPALITSIDDYRALWQAEDEKLTASEELIEQGTITIEERLDLDLAIVRLPEDLPSGVHRFAQPRLTECHPYAIHNQTDCSRLLIVQGQRVEFQYRYESWVQMASRRPLARVDLSPVAEALTAEETNGHWVFEGVEAITPKLRLEGAPASSIPIDSIVRRIEHELRVGRPAWQPYDDEGS